MGQQPAGPQRADYGIDAPGAVRNLALAGGACLALAAVGCFALASTQGARHRSAERGVLARSVAAGSGRLDALGQQGW
jgi:hypothetical protein